MKKLILTTLCCAGFSLSNAQTTVDSTQEATFGVKGGVNFSNLFTENVDDNNVLTSFNLGIFVTMPISESFAIQPEFLYSQKGAELVYDNAFAQGSAKFKLNYLEVPVLLKVNVAKNLNVHAGPYFAYLIDANVTNESSDGTFDFEENIDNDDFNKFDYGLSGGLGFDFNSLGFGIRYNYGLSTVGKERSFLGSTYTFPDGKNSNLSIYAAFQF